jgi:uncharacterized protein
MIQMKKIFLSLLLLATVNAWSQIEKVLPAQPNPPRLVTDLTGTLSPDQKETMERKLVAYDDSTSNQIAVIIVPSTGDYDISDYAFALGRKWGIGNKKNNNGVVFLIAKNDRKVFIAPGYGLEGAIPDITVNRIIQNEVLPNFKANDFYRGIDYGTDAIMDAARGEYTAPEDYANRGRPRGIPPILIIFIVIFFLWLISRKGGGGSGGAFMSRRGYRNWNGPVIFPTGGWTGGGGGWSGGSGGGGFGGFGGGSFGGGGAGGSW